MGPFCSPLAAHPTIPNLMLLMEETAGAAEVKVEDERGREWPLRWGEATSFPQAQEGLLLGGGKAGSSSPL